MLDIYSLKICQQKMITQNSQYIEKKSKKGINHAKITCGWQIKLSKHVQKSLKVGFFTAGFLLLSMKNLFVEDKFVTVTYWKSVILIGTWKWFGRIW